MTEDVIECYENLNNKGFPDELIFVKFHDQLILPDYYDLLNDDDEYYDKNNITRTPIGDVFLENEGVEDAVVPNDEEINDKIIIDYSGSLN